MRELHYVVRSHSLFLRISGDPQKILTMPRKPHKKKRFVKKKIFSISIEVDFRRDRDSALLQQQSCNKPTHRHRFHFHPRQSSYHRPAVVVRPPQERKINESTMSTLRRAAAFTSSNTTQHISAKLLGSTRTMAGGKEIRFGVEGRAAMLRGVDLMADAVQVRDSSKRQCCQCLLGLDDELLRQTRCSVDKSFYQKIES